MLSENRRWLVTLVVIIAVLGIVFLLRQTIGRFALKRVLSSFAKGINGRVEYEQLAGNLYSSPRFRNLVVVFNGDSLKIGELSFSYGLFGFLRGRIPVYRVEVLEPRLYLKSKAARKPTVEKEARVLKFPKLTVNRLHVAAGRLCLDGKPRADSIELSLSFDSRPAAVKIELAHTSARLIQENVKIRDISADCRVTTDSLVLKRLDIRTMSSSFRGNLGFAFDGSGLGGQVESLDIDLSEFTKEQGRVRAKGRVGILNGTRSGELEYRAEGLHFRNIALPVLEGRVSLNDQNLNLEVAGFDTVLGEFNLEGKVDIRQMKYTGRVILHEIAVARIEPRLPDVKLDADIRFSGSRTDSISVELGAKIGELQVDSLLMAGEYSSGRFWLDRLEMQGPSGWLWLAGSYDDGRVQTKCVMDSLDLKPFSRLVGIDAVGKLTGVVNAGGKHDSFSVAGGISATGLDIGNSQIRKAKVEFDLQLANRVSGHMVLAGKELNLEGVEFDTAQLTVLNSNLELRANRSGGQLLVLGNADLSRQGVRCDVNTCRFETPAETLSLCQPFRVVWNQDSVAIDKAEYQVAGGSIALDLERFGKDMPVVSVSGSNLNLSRLQKLLGIPGEMKGRFDFQFWGQDTFFLKFAGEDIEVSAADAVVKALDVELTLTRSWARVEQLWFVHDIDTTRIMGSAYYDMSSGFTLKHVDLEAEIADPGVWVVGFLKSILDMRDGRIYGKLAWQGDLTEPNLDGRVRIVRGTVFIPSVNATIERFDAELTADRDRIVLQKLSGRSGKGIVTASGFVDLGKNWLVDSLRYQIRPNSIPINPMPEVYAIVAGDISIAWAKNKPVSVNGSVNVEGGLLTFGFGQSAGGAGSDLLVYDIRIRGERGIWLRNRTADIELSADLSVKKTMTETVYTGQLSTRQGSVYYLDQTLRVTRGIIKFDNINRLNPSLDIVAELPVHSAVGMKENLPDKVLLTLGGTLEKPEFHFGSEPTGWDENEIITYLSLNVTTQELSAFENREMVTRYLSERFLGYFQTQVAKQVRKLLAVDAVRFESELTGGQGYKVTVGKYVGRNFYVTYTQNFTGEMQPEFRIEYYLNRRNEIIGERTENGGYSVRYRFKLRY